MNGRPPPVDRGWSWNPQFLLHYLDEVIAKVNHVFGESADLRLTKIQTTQISSLGGLTMTTTFGQDVSG